MFHKLIGHRYAIDAKRLGDDAWLAWSNLGYWHTPQQGEVNNKQDHYPNACKTLADRLAQAVQLQPHDRLLDLGCGQGAGVLHWQNAYRVEQLSAVDVQVDCIDKIRTALPQVSSYCASFLQLKALNFSKSFDVVLCIDAAYHSALPLFLQSVSSVLNHNGRFAFHYLMWSEQAAKRNLLQQWQYRYLLKSADVHDQNLMYRQEMVQLLEQQGFREIVIQDISEAVLQGFAQYQTAQSPSQKPFDLAQFKIAMTAKLCQKLYADGWVRYVQVSAVKNQPSSS